jgi:hypothetical protein
VGDQGKLMRLDVRSEFAGFADKKVGHLLNVSFNGTYVQQERRGFDL